MKIVGIILFLICALMCPIMISTGSKVSGYFLLFVGIGSLISCWKYESPKKKQRRKQREAGELQKKQFENAKAQLDAQNFALSKSIIIPAGGVFIDDANKKIAISQNNYIKTFNYSDLGKFELNENGNIIEEGKGLATVVGGLAFGTIGALAGSAGERKHQNTCSSLIVRIMINDLQNPQITIQYISTEINHDSLEYKTLLEDAKELIATLHYIESQGVVQK